MTVAATTSATAPAPIASVSTDQKQALKDQIAQLLERLKGEAKDQASFEDKLDAFLQIRELGKQGVEEAISASDAAQNSDFGRYVASVYDKAERVGQEKARGWEDKPWHSGDQIQLNVFNAFSEQEQMILYGSARMEIRRKDKDDFYSGSTATRYTGIADLKANVAHNKAQLEQAVIDTAALYGDSGTTDDKVELSDEAKEKLAEKKAEDASNAAVTALAVTYTSKAEIALQLLKTAAGKKDDDEADEKKTPVEGTTDSTNASNGPAVISLPPKPGESLNKTV